MNIESLKNAAEQFIAAHKDDNVETMQEYFADIFSEALKEEPQSGGLSDAEIDALHDSMFPAPYPLPGVREGIRAYTRAAIAASQALDAQAALAALQARLDELAIQEVRVRLLASGLGGLLSEISGTGALIKHGDEDLLDRMQQALATFEVHLAASKNGVRAAGAHNTTLSIWSKRKEIDE